MPNCITNRLQINGTPEQVAKVFDFVKGEHSPMDFNKITPMPPWVFSKSLSAILEKKYGSENCWFDWCHKNWGTSRKAWEAHCDGNTIYFETAWCGVPDLMQKIAWIFPEIEIDYWWADEDFGYNVGYRKFRDTETLDTAEPTGGTDAAYKMALFVTNSTLKEHCALAYNEAGEIYYRGCDDCPNPC